MNQRTLKFLIRARRGLKDEDLVEGVGWGSMKILATWIKESDKVVSF